MKQWAIRLRAALLALAANPGALVLATFMVSGMFTPGALGQWRGVIETNVLLPWGLALCLLRLYRAARAGGLRRDVCALLALFAWMVVPFAWRFGPTATNVNTWQNFGIVFFGVYAMVTETDEALFWRQLRTTLALFAAVSAVFAGALLYCALTAQTFFGEGEFGFGVYQQAQLCAAQHYNATGMLAMCGTFLCMAGAALHRRPAVRLLHAVPALMMALVVILAQSRTARYSLLIGLGAGAYAALAARRWHPRAWVRHAAGVLAGLVVLAGGYAAANGITHAALVHYARVSAGQSAIAVIVPSAQAEEMETPETVEQPEAVQARGAGEGTFTGRTDVWKNIFAMWKAHPKHFLIGNGVGRTGRDILVGTPLEHGGANMAHNAFIQFTMDHGLIGTLLLLAFAATIFMPLLRAFMAAQGERRGVGRIMVMLIVACLMTAMMENEPLNAMRPCNAVLFYALACAAHIGGRKAEVEAHIQPVE